MDWEEIHCPFCAEKLFVPRGKKEVFCTFCGKLIVQEEEHFQKERFSKQVESLFSSARDWVGRFSRETYSQAYGEFCEQQREFLQEADKGIQQKKNEWMIRVIIQQAMTDGEKKNRQRQYEQNTFMAVYVIPAILDEKKEETRRFSEQLGEKWAAAFKESKISVSDHQSIVRGFQQNFFSAWFGR